MPEIGILVMAYGGPGSLDEVEPYLLDVRGGRAATREAVEEVRERYRRIGGRSPILEHTRAQAEALQAALNRSAAAGTAPAFRAFVGMRHWRPTIKEALEGMSRQGIDRAVGLVMAPHYSRLSIGAYFAKVEETGTPIDVAPIERWHRLPGYLDAVAQRVREGLEKFPAGIRDDVPVIFTAHSLPRRILEWDDPYPRELEETVADLAGRLGPPGEGTQRLHFAYQSAGMTPDPWLGPDARETIERLVREGHRDLLLAPIGFVCEHVEILYDVDIVFRERAAALGARLERIAMIDAMPPLIEGLAERIRERAGERGWL